MIGRLSRTLVFRQSSRLTALRQKSTISSVLSELQSGAITAEEAEKSIQNLQRSKAPDETLASFANLDHRRASRSGFPEAVFSAGKTPHQIATILDDMAKDVNDMVQSGDEKIETYHKAILATR